MMKTTRFVAACILPFFVGCGAMSGLDTSFGTSDNTSSSTTGATIAKVAAVARSTGTFGALMVNDEGEMLLPLVDKDPITGKKQLSGALWSDATGGNVAVYFDSKGLPTKTVWGDYVLLFSNWDTVKGTVDIANVFAPNGYIKLFKSVQVNPQDMQKWNAAATASSSGSSVTTTTTKATCFPACDSDTKNLAELIKFGALGISVGACGVATTVSLGAMALPCAGLIISTASVVMSDETWLNNTEKTSGILTGIDAFKCALGSAESCISAALDVSSKTIEGIDTMLADDSGLITTADTFLTAPTMSTGVAQQGSGTLTCASAYQCTPGAYMPCYPEGVKQCGSSCTWGACPAKVSTVITGGSTGGSSGSTKDCTCYCDTGAVCTKSTQCPADTSFGITIPGVCGCPVDCK